jgi:hypothetical protein
LSLKTVDLPYGLAQIESFAFADSGLKKIVIPDTIMIISKAAFGWAAHLESVSLPQGEWDLAPDAFLGCGRLTDVYLRGGGYNPSLCSALNDIGYPQTEDVTVHVEYSCTKICGKKATSSNHDKWKIATIVLSVTTGCGVVGAIILLIFVLRRKSSSSSEAPPTILTDSLLNSTPHHQFNL